MSIPTEEIDISTSPTSIAVGMGILQFVRRGVQSANRAVVRDGARDWVVLDAFDVGFGSIVAWLDEWWVGDLEIRRPYG
jgi:hypothetical protein